MTNTGCVFKLTLTFNLSMSLPVGDQLRIVKNNPVEHPKFSVMQTRVQTGHNGMLSITLTIAREKFASNLAARDFVDNFYTGLFAEVIVQKHKVEEEYLGDSSIDLTF